MEIKEIKYLVRPTDPVNDCLDVSVSLEDCYCTDELVILYRRSNNTSTLIHSYEKI